MTCYCISWKQAYVETIVSYRTSSISHLISLLNLNPDMMLYGMYIITLIFPFDNYDLVQSHMVRITKLYIISL